MSSLSNSSYVSRWIFTSSSVFVVACFLYDIHSEWGEMDSQCSFDLYFLYG
jgi:hypothetical protein